MMIVFCEECGARNDVEPEDFSNETSPARCQLCNDILNKEIARKIKIKQQRKQQQSLKNRLKGEQTTAARAKAKAPAKAKAKIPKKKKLKKKPAPKKEIPAIIEPKAVAPEDPDKLGWLDESDLDRNLSIDEV